MRAEAERIFAKFERTKTELRRRVGNDAYWCLRDVRPEEDGSLSFSVRRKGWLGLRRRRLVVEMNGLNIWGEVAYPDLWLRSDDWGITHREIKDTETFLRAVEELR